MINESGQRELCYIVKIDAIEPIVGSDNCEAAIVGGWKIMTKKGDFKQNDLAIYFEIDSKVPEKEPFMFLAKKHFRIKTQKYTFGGKGNFISQGLLMKLDDFPNLFFKDLSTLDNLEWCYIQGIKGNEPAIPVKIGDFLTKELEVTYSNEDDNRRKSNITKYDKMYQRHIKLFKKYKWLRDLYKKEWGKKLLFIFLGKKKDNLHGWPTGKFPGVSKTDQERIENMTWILENKTPFIQTLKIDGTSATFILERKPFGKYEEYICSRNVRMFNENQSNYHSDTENVYWQAYEKFKIRNFLEGYIKHFDVDWVCLQGEIAGCSESGKKIQGDPHQLGELRFFGFHLTDPNGRYNQLSARDICVKNGIEWVPIINENYILPDDLNKFKLEADGPCEIGSGNREGYVYYKTDEPTFSFKNVSNEYLLNH